MLKSTKIATFFGVISLIMFAITLYAAIDLNFFQGVWNGNQVTLNWETGTELNHSAFHIWRSTENLLIDVSFQIDTSQAERLTSGFILNPDSNPCTSQGYEYQYVNDTVDENREAYYYYLETFNCSDGNSEFQGSLEIIGGLKVTNPSIITPTPTNESQLYLPITTK